ncbi:tyrosine-type recombinase/integrase [Halorubrum vacuolatum]|uniref:Phage integrase, N-terminal SAM-like domain n=1 Tax=Halorubrum vacuolatum TaxID=63740 RepID=A0A238WRU5_HALVU|nr:site-specific integrase [Halorubrum vacuolatum]SNR49128.1 Phage integrase, N-terminal SAM-like domain [Halorubrum vacuolatum]
MSDDLEPLDPARAVEMYLEARQDELSDRTLSGHMYRLDAFVQWCEETGVENLNDLSGRDMYEFRIWRREGNGEDREPITTITLRGQLATVRSFLGFCAEVNAVPEALREKVPLPTVTSAEGVSDSTLDPERAVDILDYLSRYRYASRRHVVMLLLWHTGARVGGIRALDVGDCDLDSDRPGVKFAHRPESDTPLKNGPSGERWNAISAHVARVLQDYIKSERENVVDKFGRHPLVTTSKGRPAVSTLRSDLYVITRPCWRTGKCPHDREIEDCQATMTLHASKCPSSRSPHDVRSGRVTAYKRDDVPRQVVSDRLNASEDVLDRHYDRRGEREKAEQRRDYLPRE